MIPNPNLKLPRLQRDKNLVDVVIALDLQPEVREIYRQFLKLHNMHELVKVTTKCKIISTLEPLQTDGRPIE